MHLVWFVYKNQRNKLIIHVLEILDSMYLKDCYTLFLLIKRLFSSWLAVLWSKTYVFNKGWFDSNVTRLLHHCYSPQRWLIVGYINCTLKRSLWVDNWKLLFYDLYLIWDYLWTILRLVLCVKTLDTVWVKLKQVRDCWRLNVARIQMWCGLFVCCAGLLCLVHYELL